MLVNEIVKDIEKQGIKGQIHMLKSDTSSCIVKHANFTWLLGHNTFYEFPFIKYRAVFQELSNYLE